MRLKFLTELDRGQAPRQPVNAETDLTVKQAWLGVQIRHRYVMGLEYWQRFNIQNGL